MRATGVTCLALAALAGIASAQAPTDNRPPLRWSRAGGIHAGFPNGVSMAVGVKRPLIRRERVDPSPGNIFAVVEPGLGASRVSVGYVYLGDLGGGVSLRASAMKIYYEESTFCLGIELGMYKFGFLGARVGAFRALNNTTPSKERLGIDLSFGY